MPAAPARQSARRGDPPPRRRPGQFTAAEAGKPTAHPPGSPGKLAVLAARARHGLPLFVAGDARSDLLPGVSEVTRYRARVSLGGARVTLGEFASPGEANEAVRDARQAHGVERADAALALAGWDVDDEAGCECAGGGCSCG